MLREKNSPLAEPWGEITLKPTLHRKNLKPVVYVTGDVAGTIESPAYAMTAVNDRIGGLELPDGGDLEIFYRDEPWSTERAAIKWPAPLSQCDEFPLGQATANSPSPPRSHHPWWDSG